MIQGKIVQSCNGLSGNRTHYGRPLAAPGRGREDTVIKGERVDKCERGSPREREGEGRERGFCRFKV